MIELANAHEVISIHALRGEGDYKPCENGETLTISIHALRGEGDQLASGIYWHEQQDFNPRPPWGGRRFPLP